MDLTHQTIIINTLRDNFSTVIRERAIQVINSGDLSETDFDPFTNTYAFEIKRYPYNYYIEIRFSQTDKHADCYCSCPYNGEGYCKHIGAALYYLHLNTNDHIPGSGTKTIKPEADKSNSGRPKSSVKALSLTKQHIAPLRQRSSEKLFFDFSDSAAFSAQKFRPLYNQSHWRNTLKSIEIKDQHVVFDFESYGYAQASTRLANKNKVLEISCACDTQTKKFCVHETDTIKFLLDKGMAFFESFESESLLKMRQEYLDRIGLQVPPDEIDQYVSYSFDGDRIIPIPANRAKGLYNLNKVHDLIKDVVLSPVQDKALLYASLSEPEQSTLLKPAIVIDTVFNHHNLGIRFIPVMGKVSGAGDKLTSHITECDDSAFSVFPQKDHALLTLINKVDSVNINVYSANNEFNLTAAKLFPLTLGTFRLLKDQIVYLKKVSYGHELRKSDLKLTNISANALKVEFTLSEESNFYALELCLNSGNGPIPYNSKDSLFEEIHPFIIKHQNTLFHLASLSDFIVYNNLKELAIQRCLKKDLHELFSKVIEPLSKDFTIHFQNGISVNSVYPDIRKKKIYISENESKVIFTPVIEYDGHEVNILKPFKKYVFNEQTVTMIDFDITELEEMKQFIVEVHPAFMHQNNGDFLWLDFSVMMKDFWFYEAFEKIKKNNIEIHGLNDLKNFRYSVSKPTVKISVSSGIDWFDTDLDVRFGDERVTANQLAAAVNNKSRFIQLSHNKVGMLPEEWLEKFAKIFRNTHQEKNSLRLSKLNFGVIEDLLDPMESPEVFKEVAEKKARLASFSGIKKVNVPKQIKAKLRNYQKEGLSWLNFLDEFKWGGILADDMGLGKTLQVISFLQKLTNENSKIPHLIVAPTSLLFNWQDELCKFAPELKFYIHHGQDRLSKHKDLLKQQIIITSYGTLTSDLDLFEKINFHYVILDESQAIKNVFSQRYKAVIKLKATNRLALTGTPIENNTSELYAQMSFVNPGFLNGLNHFKTNYCTPIDVHGNEEISRELRKRLAPFILRRLKKDVLEELPDKEEEIIYCVMDKQQHDAYEATRIRCREKVMNQIEKDGLNKSAIHVLEGLTKLRQLCNSPSMVGLQGPSIKLKELVRYITQKTGQEKILVFSQFVKMLTLIENELKAHDIDYKYLDGSSTQKQRENNVKDFKNDESVRVFLISLKAGGVGLNLTEAQTVFIVDPWWNPAVENQAIDRCYRIGQKKNVMAYRMICKDTIEEKILKLQEKKLKLAGSLLDKPEKTISRLSREDIEDLFG